MSKHLTIRIFAGDAIAVCHSLQHGRSNEHGSSNWHRSPYCMEPLTLDEKRLGPLSFDIIDSSNLADHLGSLNLLVATSPLLKESVFATLYTESLVAQEKDREVFRARMLCGDFPTMSILLGLVPMEYWINASAISTVEENMMNSMSPISASDAGQTQMFCRMGWKRIVPVFKQGSSPRIHFKSSDLAAIVYDVYQNMFQHQNMVNMPSELSLAIPSKLSNQCCNWSTLVAFLKLLKSQVVVDWPEFIQDLVSRIASNRTIIIGSNYIQELYVQLELQQVYTMPNMAQQTLPPTFMDGIGAWAKKPSVICITLLVPRDSLNVFTNQSALQLGTPMLQATVQSKVGFMGRFNIFSDLQLSFGRVITTGESTNSIFRIAVEENPTGWFGSSPLLISFFVPTYSIMLDPDNYYVSLGIQSSPMNIPIMLSLGHEMMFSRHA
jgi:hypothetical protein